MSLHSLKFLGVEDTSHESIIIQKTKNFSEENIFKCKFEVINEDNKKYKFKLFSKNNQNLYLTLLNGVTDNFNFFELN